MIPTPQDQYSIQATLERFEDKFAVLKNETYGEFRWPVKNLPEDLQIGETILIKISTQKLEQEEKFEQMRRLLEELIN